MAISGHSPVSGLSPRRRSLLLGGVGGASTAALATLGHSGTAAASQSTGSASESAAQPPLDLDNGNFMRDLSIGADGDDVNMLSGLIAPMDVTLLIRVNNLVHFGWFDALAPYHPTAVGVHTQIKRRPSSESATNRNMNIAGLYASYRVVKGMLPERAPIYRDMLSALGLDPDDESEDPTSPVGIGNLAGKGVIAARLHDGINQLGDEGRMYNGQPYADYTGYRPVNTAYDLVNPSQWQPQLTPHRRRLGQGTADKGIFAVQHFVTPQMRLVEPRTFRDPSQFTLAPPRHSDHTRPAEYKRSVDEILEASAGLTDEQKVKAEFFDNKLLGIGFSAYAAAEAYERENGDLGMHRWAQLFVTHSLAMFEALIAVWHQKTTYNAVRPWSAIRHVYGSGTVSAWGGVGVGTVDDMPANEWASYLNVADHPEYPSGSTTLCAAEAQATRRCLDTDVMDWTHTIPAGGGVVEPGITPARDVEFHWDTWSDFIQDCAISRVWGGVHFSKTVERSLEFGEQFGDLAYDYVRRHVNGDAED